VSILATDDFAGTGALSANWTAMTGASFAPERVSGVCGGGHGSARYGAYYSGISWPNDQYAKVTLKSPVETASDNGGGPQVRTAVGADTSYFLQSNTSESRIYKGVTGSFTQLGSDGTAGAVNDVVYIEAVGTSITGKKNGSTIIGPVTDSAIASGKAAVFLTPVNVAAVIDDFEGGDFSGGAAVQPSLMLLGVGS
jgi:hypothetical protein